ncbi:hypothetical protein D5R93_10925 [Actinomyces lilanjuaniae]|uniref:Uncharacterized protein n=1 Tax=Actinomyces lilanjuaniae TaxID=2321394 RepID=A0ABM6Z4V5_9ACTO|nr:hypothetical protein [Actinomyces lilanjuaniae]AYD90385.1 hypothetical protein D5R93_10925 [Actinomyces lilanjuaniae]
MAILGIFVGGFVAFTFMVERRDDIPADWAIFLGSYDSEVFPDPVETTEQTCTEDLPCRWAVTSDTAVVMMFDDQRDACRAADTLPRTVRHDWLAVQFTPGALSVQQRADLLLHFDSYYRSTDALDDLPWIIRRCP